MADRETILGWLDDFGMGYEEEPEADEGFRWGVVAHGAPFNVLVAERDVTWVNVYLQARIGVAPDHREALVDAEADHRDAFLFDLKIELAKTPVGHAIHFDEEGLPKAVVLALNIMEEPTTRAGFMRRVHQLQSAGILVVQVFQKFDRFKRWPI